jgi:glycerol-3-phosphate dehydrogenase
LQSDYPFLSNAHASRLAHAYGTRARKILGNASTSSDLGEDFGASLTEAEVRYLMAQEWALSAEDIVWRRSKLGLRLSAAQIAALDRWVSQHSSASAVA